MDADEQQPQPLTKEEIDAIINELNPFFNDSASDTYTLDMLKREGMDMLARMERKLAKPNLDTGVGKWI